MGDASYRFKWLVWGLVIAILVLGLLRMLWIAKEDTEYSTVNAEAAAIWAGCLPSVTVEANSRIGLTSLQEDGEAAALLGGPQRAKLEYVATNDVAVEPLNPSLNAVLEGPGDATLPKGSELRVEKGEFWLTGNVEANISGGGRILLEEPERLRLKPAADQSYFITLSDAVNLAPAKTGSQRLLPAGTRGTLKLLPGKNIEVATLETTSGKPLLLGAPAKLVPVRAFGEKGPSALSIEVEKGPLIANDLAACAISGGQTFQASITDVAIEKGRNSNITVNLPSDVLPEWGLPAPVRIAVVSTDGKFIAHGGLRAYPRLWGAIIASLLTAALFGTILKTRYMTIVPSASDKSDWGRWFAGLFISDESEPSLSLFQVFFWTVITVWGLFYTFAVTGSLLQLTPQMLLLLGIAGTGSVFSRWIGLSRGDATSASGISSEVNDDQTFRFWTILNTRGQFDLMKLQLLIFTLLLGVYVVCRIAESAAFPVLDANTLLLLGISQGVYIGGKLGATTPLARAQSIQLELEVNREVVSTLAPEIQNDEKSRDTLKADKVRLEAEKAALESGAGDTAAILKKKTDIQQLEMSLNQLDAVIKDKQAKSDAATKKAAELKAALEKLLKDLELAT